ncbi:MAG: VCBS repeat-containing protein [bacterium]|nr:VCBS repeat-containing protein [Candidatus Sumerlaeota bacterium]
MRCAICQNNIDETASRTARLTRVALCALLTVALCGVPAIAQEPDDDAQPTASFSADLNGDGQTETVKAAKFGKQEIGDFYGLSVYDASDKLIWKGPRTLDTQDPLIFGSWDFGVSLPEVVADIDGDGAVELVAPAPVSDVSPVTFRVLRWQDDAFKPVFVKRLMEKPAGSGLYPWAKPGEDYYGRWVSKFLGAEDNQKFKVKITEYQKGQEQAGLGTAVIALAEKGYKVERWIKPMPQPTATEQKTETETPSAAVKSPANGVLAEYMCQIGDEDLRNTAGERLKTVRDILGQDRANFHRYKIRHRRDIGEETFFASANNRQMFQAAPIECPNKLANWIIQGGAIVEVTVYPGKIVVSQPR